jgi:hypothetical protein
MVVKKYRRVPRKALTIALAATSLVAVAGVGSAYAKGGGGTAKPPKGAVSPWVIPTLPDPVLTGPAAQLHGFDDTGLIEAATADSCAPGSTAGGTVTINGAQIVIPSNLVVQMPANTLTWPDFVCPSLSGSGPNGPAPLTGLELRVVGNMVGTRHIAGLAFVSQLSTDVHSGIITGFDYANGIIDVADNNGGTDRVQLNDPKLPGTNTGRFSAGQSPDPRFSVDQDNPTVHSATGYPMCIPRTDPSRTDDPLCPQANRPNLVPVTVGGTTVAAKAGCRNFSQAGVLLPAAGELGRPALGQAYCSQYVMPAVTARAAGDPDASQQAPFEVGDFITFSGTKFTDSVGDYISAHTVEANLGIYTQPGTQPAYIAIGEFGVGSADPQATAINGVTQEAADRIFLESETTDVKTPVDIYYLDAPGNAGNPAAAPTRNRWITPFEMTGENQTPVSGPTGGITTQNTGAQPQRARLRATKAPNGLLSQPSRTVRVAQRTLCLPTPVDPTTTTINQAALDSCMANAPLVANGLRAGEYTAPTFEFIFPENVLPGDLTVPADLWHLPFLVSGDGTNGTGALSPTPW